MWSGVKSGIAVLCRLGFSSRHLHGLCCGMAPPPHALDQRAPLLPFLLHRKGETTSAELKSLGKGHPLPSQYIAQHSINTLPSTGKVL